MSYADATAFAASLATPAMNGCFFLYRDTPYAPASFAGAFPANYPNTWLRLVRAGNTFTASAPACIAATISVGVKAPGNESKPSCLVLAITRASQFGDTINVPPALATCCTSLGAKTVPAPTAQRSPNAVASCAILANALEEFKVTSTAVSPPAIIAATISCSRPPKSPRKMAMTRPRSTKDRMFMGYERISIDCSESIPKVWIRTEFLRSMSSTTLTGQLPTRNQIN